MTVQDVCHLIRSYQEHSTSVHTIHLQQKILTDVEKKAIRSSAVVFNLSTTSCLRCEFHTRPIVIDKTKDEIQLGAPFCRSLALLISVVSLSIFGTYCYSRYLIRSYRQAVIDCANGKYAIYNSYNIRLRSATVWDLMKGPFAAGFFGAMGVLVALIKTIEIFDRAAQEGFTKTVLEVRVEFKDFIRQLPDPLSNLQQEMALIDPISFEEIPIHQACLPRYLHVANAVIEISYCLKAIFQKDLEHDQVKVPRFQHPLEGHRLIIDDMYQLEEEIAETLCIPYNGLFKSQLYDCWNVGVTQEEVRQQIRRMEPEFPIDSYPDLNDEGVVAFAIAAQKALIQRKRELKFLTLFDSVVYDFLPAFQPPQAHERI